MGDTGFAYSTAYGPDTVQRDVWIWDIFYTSSGLCLAAALIEQIRESIIARYQGKERRTTRRKYCCRRENQQWNILISKFYTLYLTWDIPYSTSHGLEISSIVIDLCLLFCKSVDVEIEWKALPIIPK